MKKTITIKWGKPFENMWLADTNMVHLVINKLKDGTYSATFKYAELDWEANVNSKYQHMLEAKTLKEAKQWCQDRFDEHFLPVAKRMRTVRKRRKPFVRPMWPRQKFCY